MNALMKDTRRITRPVKSCTICRQLKIKCDAAATAPNPCSHCSKHGRNCVIDPSFQPKRGGQVEMLRQDVNTLMEELQQLRSQNPEFKHNGADEVYPNKRPRTRSFTESERRRTSQSSIERRTSMTPPPEMGLDQAEQYEENTPNNIVVPHPGPFVLESVTLSLDEASNLHQKFKEDFLPFVPIFDVNSAGELYARSELLFWSVMVTALSALDPDLYLQLAEPVKRLAIDVCWLHTPRSTHVVQALLVLVTWPLPSEKVLDDLSYRFTMLARGLALQLGMHRGKYFYEFSRKQILMPNAVKWRTRTWVLTYISEQFISATLGLPPSSAVDYLIDQAVSDTDLPNSLTALLKLAIFHSKMTSMMGCNVHSPDGLLDPKMRGPTLSILSQDLERLGKELPLDMALIDVCYNYVKCMLCCYAFLPDIPEGDQSYFIVDAYHAATQAIRVMQQLVGSKKVTEFPAFLRQAGSLSALILFRLHILPQFPREFVEEARHCVVAVHRMYRQVTVQWQGVQNVAKILEGLNHVLIAHPDLLTGQRQIMSRMRSRLTNSIFYELIWAIHEARRRNNKRGPMKNVPKPLIGPDPQQNAPRVAPLPLVEQPPEDVRIETYTSPNGTTSTRSVPVLADLSEFTENQNPDLFLQGLDWMTGDGFLGWMPDGEFTV